MKKIICAILIVSLLTVGAFTLVACNGDSDEKLVTIGYTLYEPMNYEDENGNLIGFDTDLAKAVFDKLGYKVVFKIIDWNNKYIDLNTGSVDCLWNGFTANSADDDGVQRSEKVDFSYNYMLNAQAVVVKTDSSITSASDLVGKTGYAENGSAGEAYANELLGDSGSVSTATKQTDAILQVKTGAAEYAVVDYQLAKSIVGKGDFANLKMIDSLKSESEYYAIGFKKGSDLTAKVNQALVELAADGTIREIAERYGVETSVITDYSDQING